ncbi:AAR013Wp [Eremothecium gossypii ATCC 10895]|uniref:Mitochondrial import protein 1 n=1 Tax=Eremothecium gossypii (strain ATCC 10895 / CBS 109.51 / FGSC 9923 / NRRL Y-1056) TaxID=284811 RepID=MIM1_EREGS|nr:AAR013Wp [Eremothecium gossypii ATCC 10895]P62512.1 RecName: Full=Mitochondrial import protein 1 [Eremothecium gossypii ATCC 10895]AAS50378.2 AAR013Wp [Eremothecium gossypii ATCC 10895]AEY94664.1 FAAR013Wp [Eremothecium gossypii FDAG1]
MAEEILGNIAEEAHAALLASAGDEATKKSGAIRLPIEDSLDGDFGSRGTAYTDLSTTTSAGTSGQLVERTGGISFGRLLSVAGSCSINLLLPFLNGLMLGFGELLAHELSWKFSWFDKERNRGYRIYPEVRKAAELQERERQRALSRAAGPDGFL